MVLLATAVCERPDRGGSRSPPDVQSTHTLGAVTLVSAERKKIYAPAANIDGYATERLGCIAMHQGSGGVGDLYDRPDGLNRADLIVYGLNTDEKCLGAHCLGEGPEVEQTIAVHGKLLEREPLL